MASLIKLLLETGILQFGQFFEHNTIVPIQVNVSFLPSYPDVLTLIAQLAAEQVINLNPERLVATADSLPFGIAVSLKTNIPLIYIQNNDPNAVSGLIGAYDIGHPAVLLTNLLHQPQALLLQANRVGLDIKSIISIFSLGGKKDDEDEYALLHLPEIIEALAHNHTIPQGQAETVLTWLRTINTANHHHQG